MSIKFNHIFISIISITFIYSFVVGAGYYGFGIDYHTSYHNNNLDWGGWQNSLGYKISTFTIFNKHIGVHLVSALLAYSTGKLIEVFFKNKKIYSTSIFILIFVLVLHTWPIIMSTSNAMRQGITMSLVFLCFVNLLNQKFFLALIFVFLSVFTHRSGIFFLFIFINFWTLRLLLNRIKITKLTNLFVFLYSLFLQFFVYCFLRNINDYNLESRIIGGDFRYPFLLISLIFILIYTSRFKNLIFNDLNLYTYLFSFLSIPILLIGLNWEYERLMMMMTIPYVLIFSSIFHKRYFCFLLVSLFGLLLGLTFYQGMYESLK